MNARPAPARGRFWLNRTVDHNKTGEFGESDMEQLKKRPLFHPDGEIEVRKRRMINGNTTNLNDLTI